MKRAVSISLGSSKRDKTATLTLLGETVQIERRGTDGSMARAAQLFAELDGQVEALGLGGADLGFNVAGRWHPLYSVQSLARAVKRTPVVDGGGLKNTLERRVTDFMDARLGAALAPRRVLMTGGVDRWGMACAFAESRYDCVFGDLMFAFGLDVPLRTTATLTRLAAILMPIAGRLPFEWLYPTGEKQEHNEPKFERWYAWATVIAGDCHYIKRHMPSTLVGKIICTNTTTAEDVEKFRAAGVTHLITTTPVIEGRSFGANLLEAALVAASGKGRKLTDAELTALIDELRLAPTLTALV
jgi:hypothetical protein